MPLKKLKTAKGEQARVLRLKQREIAIIDYINEWGGVCSDHDLKRQRGFLNSARELVKLHGAKVVRVDGQWRVFDALAAAV